MTILDRMGQPLFDRNDFLRAAREIVAARGPAAVTVGSVTERLQAPTGSFYHRFPSRDALLGELWLSTVSAFQDETERAIASGGWLGAALHTPAWARTNLDEACFLLLYNRDDFLWSEWPERLKRGFAEQARRVEGWVRQLAREELGGTKKGDLRRASFVLIDVPLAAVRPHLRRRERPPTMVDELIRVTYEAVIGSRDGNRPRLRRQQPRNT